MAVLSGLKDIKFEVLLDYRQSPRNNIIIRSTLERDNYICQKCGFCEDLQVHHIISLYLGGIQHVSNTITLCSECHDYAPDKPYAFFKWIKRDSRIIHSSSTYLIRTFLTYLKCEGFDSDIIDNLGNDYILQIKKSMNPSADSCWRYRHSQDIWEKDNLNDLFNLRQITDCVFGKLFDEKELLIQNVHYKNGEINKTNAIMEIHNLKNEFPTISNRKISGLLGITHKTIAKYIKNGRNRR